MEEIQKVMTHLWAYKHISMNELRIQLYYGCFHYYFILFNLREFFTLLLFYLGIYLFQFQFILPMIHLLVRKMTFFFLLIFFYFVCLRFVHSFLGYFLKNRFQVQYLFTLNN